MQNYLTSLRPDLIKNPSISCTFLAHIYQMELLLNLTFSEATSLWITFQTSSRLMTCTMLPVYYEAMEKLYCQNIKWSFYSFQNIPKWGTWWNALPIFHYNYFQVFKAQINICNFSVQALYWLDSQKAFIFKIWRWVLKSCDTLFGSKHNFRQWLQCQARMIPFIYKLLWISHLTSPPAYRAGK